MMEISYARRESRNQRLNRSFQTAISKNDADGIVKNRFALLGYSYDDSGSGSALASITAAAASLGSAYIVSQAPNNAVYVPTRTNPAYGAATPSTSKLFLVVLAIVAVGLGLFFVSKG